MNKHFYFPSVAVPKNLYPNHFRQLPIQTISPLLTNEELNIDLITPRDSLLTFIPSPLDINLQYILISPAPFDTMQRNWFPKQKSHELVFD